MNFLLIGNGFIAQKHKEAIGESGGKVIRTIDIDEGEDAWREAVDKVSVDCVVILTPNDLHFEMAKLAAERGKIVLCEKPLVLKSEQAKILSEYPNIFGVFQLRHHPLLHKIRNDISSQEENDIKINIFFKRDQEYATGWKGNKNRSGGFLMNIGIHYFDLLLYLFGEAKETKTEIIQEKIINGLTIAEARGIIRGQNYNCDWNMCINKKENDVIIKKREFIIDKKAYNFSSKDNLGEENLHSFVYKDLLKNKGILPAEAFKSIELVEKIYQSYSPPHQL